MRQVLGLVFVLAGTGLGAGVSVIGCSSDPDVGTTTDTGKKSDGGSDTGGGTTDTGTGGGDTGTKTDTGKPPTGDSACGAAASNSECQKCCSTNHDASYKEFVNTLLTCGCKAGNCDTACKATACAATPASPDAGCTKCLNDIQLTGCKADLSACASAGCADFFTCISDQACNDKP